MFTSNREKRRNSELTKSNQFLLNCFLSQNETSFLTKIEGIFNKNRRTIVYEKYSVSIYLFKFNNRSTRKRSKIS